MNDGLKNKNWQILKPCNLNQGIPALGSRWVVSICHVQSPSPCTRLAPAIMYSNSNSNQVHK